MEKFVRVKMLLGENNLQVLKNSSVAVFGIGGVGGYTAEALIRSGVGKLTLIDNDTIDISNINRQIIATTKNVGEDKVDAMKERLLSINPQADIKVHKTFYMPENADKIPLDEFDYVVDAVDTVSAKIELIMRAKSQNVKIISCMGTGGKMDLTALRVCDISKTKGCPLARVMRRELNKRGITDVKVVYSEEQVVRGQNSENEQKKADGKIAPPSMIFVPATAGLLLAKEVISDLINGEKE